VSGEALRVTVVVPTYRRPEQLARCLAGIQAQTRPADEVVVVRREDDLASRDHLVGVSDITAVTVTEPGVLAAMNAGVAASTSEVLAFIDDDAVPRPEWLRGLVGPLSDPGVGGVGGRDDVHTLPEPTLATEDEVGVITAWGKLIGGHHLGRGPARDVTVLKGVNMAFRREALALPRTLRGAGAQVHFEVATGLWARQHGWRLVYDPAIVVDHYPGPRFDPDRRERPDPVAVYDAAYNLVTCLVSLQPRLTVRRALYGLLVGDAMTPGLVRALVGLARGDRAVTARLLPSLRGQSLALAHHVKGHTLEMITPPPLGGTIDPEGAT
jgi:glycosyltransferase involved in cell wall biosynthesis